ncbi:CBS domain-containing protein [Alphaproteobacteria bacterium GH1-50]|uniref:CBS domain-containing protein n=1 Tax=Kangsaoukella pontilimi TaxID=2691042 RepID=A0A7C9II64_9RHOB|nr:nucleotidyltransferase family protein [Kangsaoukella pontilimi]MXQ09149.1 CBS domain-containing protein [Kangsaoukella pontilimi]
MDATTLKSLTIGPETTIRAALEVIDRSKRQIALVVDDEGRLVASLTDGDVRRGLLRGVSLDAPVSEVMHTSPTTVRQGAPDAATRRLIAERKLHHVPVLDDGGRLVDLALVEDLFGVRPNPARIVLMAGGLGTRLRPLTETVPKPMLEVGGKPLLEQIIAGFAEQGFWRITVSVNYRKEMVQDYFGDGSALGVEIDYVEEEKRMGTAGALSLLPERPEGPFVVMNGDLLVSLRFDQLLDFHRRLDAAGTMVVREYAHQVPYGVVRHEGDLMTGIEEKPVARYFVNGGIYVLSPEALDHVPEGEALDMPNLLTALNEADKRVAVFPLRDYWRDIGRMDDLEAARSEFGSVFRE